MSHWLFLLATKYKKKKKKKKKNLFFKIKKKKKKKKKKIFSVNIHFIAFKNIFSLGDTEK